MPPALRNQRTPTAGDTLASTAASSLERPEAIALQNALQLSRWASRSRLGDPKVARTSERLSTFIATSFAEVLRRPVESALAASVAVMHEPATMRRLPVMESLLERIENKARMRGS